ncbi:MAG: hypothetical protein AYK22_01285 [Thermoplasmatales archaeon SG8-52-3]|nr:MAG: hypothetical protein AYK22_01285 [Thermoplasmatales archaeon SG8-52-3]
MEKIISQKILIFGIILMLIFSFGPMISSGNSNIINSKQPDITTNLNEKKQIYFFEESQNQNGGSFEKKIKTGYNYPETAFVCGFVSDKDTDLPIENVEVFLFGEDDEGNYWYNYSYTNTSGYYGMHTSAGYIYLSFYRNEYFSEYIDNIVIDPYDILWFNVSLTPIPPVTVTVCGYIKNKITEEPIPNVFVDLDWYDDYGHSWDNDSYTNISGFYKMGAPAGDIKIDAHPDGYYYCESDWYNANENQTIWINLSLQPIPPQTAIVFGYITDKMSGEPIEDADIQLYWRDEEGNYDYNYTDTDGWGFYKIYTNPGRIRIRAYKTNYEYEYSEYYWIEDNQTIWINLSLNFEPDETLAACGYVVDTVTLAPVKYAYVRYDWKDDEGHMYSKYTHCDKAGYYFINVPPGSAQFLITSFGYEEFETSWFDFNESKAITWINISISPQITIQIDKPLPGLYINNNLKTPFLSKIFKFLIPNIKPLIIGPITIEANITKNTSGVNRVDFYIDGVFQKSDNIEPYNFTWNKTALFTHTIKVIAYDNAGTINIKTLRIRRLT